MIDYFKIDRWPYVIFLQNQKEYGNMDYKGVSKITEFEKIDPNNPNMLNKLREVKERINNQPFMEAIDYAIASLR